MDGQINLTRIIAQDESKPITLTIVEEKVPERAGCYYKKIEGRTITLTNNSGKWSIAGSETQELSDNNFAVNITNKPYITLSGLVWEDKQVGDKNIQAPNGYLDYYYVGSGKGSYTKANEIYTYVGSERGDWNYSKESRLNGVLVGLYSVKDKKIIRTYTTGEDKNLPAGAYEFKDIEKTSDGYKIVFSYDGINWQETKSLGARGTDSKADEDKDERDIFNGRFKTIFPVSTNNSITIGQSKDGTKLKYISENNESKLQTNMDGTNPEDSNKSFKMDSVTYSTYKTTNTNINCGLVKKEFDLAAGTDVKSARIEINGNSREYTYAQIKDGVLDFQGKSSDANDVQYNLYLYTSDYKYRISDYKTGIKNQINAGDDANIVAGNELEVYVTYSIALKEQTTHNARVDKFIYYYDKDYIPLVGENSVIGDYKVTKEDGKLTFTKINDEYNLISQNYRVNLELTFQIKKNSEGNVITKEFQNAIEIAEYSTEEGGLIDKDSAPGNAKVTYKNNGTTPEIKNCEDDEDVAKGLNVIAPTNRTRTISGTVFEDRRDENKTGNGIKDDGENTVNDVIVQLIELKQVGENYYEYIWQETRSGSNVVKTTARNGYTGTKYKFIKNSARAGTREYVTENEGTENEEKVLYIYEKEICSKGEYKFIDFIPGNYIIRFIYGDGRTEDDNLYMRTTDIMTYNGQDYKSTIDPKYTEEWYNKTNYGENASVARDNEARRLEVMAYSTVIDYGIGTNLNEKNKNSLENTWMAAETSKVRVEIGDAKASSETATSFGNMNFGLTLRPQTKLELEKHITALKITPSGNGALPIVNARADISKVLDDKEGAITGLTTGLATIKSTRTDRGFWQVATDVEELMQGAELEVEYTYVIKNEGEKDYLNQDLISEYQDKISKDSNNNGKNDYEEYLESKKYDTRGKTHEYGNSLGKWYYTGNIGSTDEEVPSRIENRGLEEAINNALVFEPANNTSNKTFEIYPKYEGEVAKNERKVYDADDNKKDEIINTVVRSNNSSKYLVPGEDDCDITIRLTKTLSSTSGGELGATIPSYIAEIINYSNAAGRRDMYAVPENLEYVHSEDKEMTLNTLSYRNSSKEIKYTNDTNKLTDEEKSTLTRINEYDEFWGESIIITKPTGENKTIGIQIAIITIASIAVLGAGIVLIKKFVLKK